MGSRKKSIFFYGRAIKTLSKFFLYNLSLNIRPFTPPPFPLDCRPLKKNFFRDFPNFKKKNRKYRILP